MRRRTIGRKSAITLLLAEKLAADVLRSKRGVSAFDKSADVAADALSGHDCHHPLGGLAGI